MQVGKDYIGIGVGILLFNDRNEVLLIHRSPTARNDQDKWSIPGGEVEFWETVISAIIRETAEEVNIRVAPGNIRHIGYIDNRIVDDKQHWLAEIFASHTWFGDIQNMEPEKCQAIAWFSIDKLPDNITFVAAKAVELYKSKKTI